MVEQDGGIEKARARALLVFSTFCKAQAVIVSYFIDSRLIPTWVRCSNAGNSVERRWPALLHRRPALPNGVGSGVGRLTRVEKAIEYHEWLLQQEAQPRLTRTPIFRDREDAERRLRADYFDDHCKYPLYYFRRRFRMSRKPFLRIVNDILSYTANPLPQHFHFFTSRLDCTGRMSISALMKCTADIRQFAYGSTTDAFDEYLQMSEHTVRDALFFFNMCIIELYMPKYLRKPTSEDVVNIQQKHNNVHGFSEMLGSIDSGANNDINVLDNYQLFDDLLDDLAHVVPYVVNGVEYRNGVKKVHGKMSNVLSVFSKDVGDLFNNWPVHTKLTHYIESLAWHGQYGRGDKKYPTIMLEAVASQDLWIWHAFFGIAGANNDINVLDNSPLFDDLLDDLAPSVPYVVNGVEYRNGYRAGPELFDALGET
nr:protein ALP1-like [Tanacetum cinerariifolium]